MVSSKGFTRTAITKATAYNIRCLSLDKVAGFDWCEPTSITLLRRNITHAALQIQFEQGAHRDNPVLYDETNQVFDKARSIPMAQAALKASPNLPFDVGTHHVRFHQKNPAVYLMEGQHRVQALSCTLLVSFTVTTEEVPMSFQAYSHADTNMPITQAAVATVDMGDGHHVDFVLSTDAEGGIALGYVPNSTKPD